MNEKIEIQIDRFRYWLAYLVARIGWKLYKFGGVIEPGKNPRVKIGDEYGFDMAIVHANRERRIRAGWYVRYDD